MPVAKKKKKEKMSSLQFEMLAKNTKHKRVSSKWRGGHAI